MTGRGERYRPSMARKTWDYDSLGACVPTTMEITCWAGASLYVDRRKAH